MSGRSLDPADEALAAALNGALPGSTAPTFSLTDLSHRTGLPVAALQAIEREGFLRPQLVAGQPCYTAEDLAALQAGMALLQAGLPLGELLALGRRFDGALRAVADDAVDLFVRFIRDPVRAHAISEQEAAGHMVDAFERMLPAATCMVAHQVRQLLVAAARDRIHRETREAHDGADG